MFMTRLFSSTYGQRAFAVKTDDFVGQRTLHRSGRSDEAGRQECAMKTESCSLIDQSYNFRINIRSTAITRIILM